MSDILKHLSDDNFENGIANGVTLVDFYADWCGPCKMIAPIIEELAQDMQGKASIAKINVDNAQNTATEFQVTSIPTIILFKNGKEIKRVVGIKGKEDLKQLIQSAL